MATEGIALIGLAPWTTLIFRFSDRGVRCGKGLGPAADVVDSDVTDTLPPSALIVLDPVEPTSSEFPTALGVTRACKGTSELIGSN